MPLSNILLVRGRSDDASWIESIGVASIGTYVFYPIDRLVIESDRQLKTNSSISKGDTYKYAPMRGLTHSVELFMSRHRQHYVPDL